MLCALLFFLFSFSEKSGLGLGHSIRRLPPRFVHAGPTVGIFELRPQKAFSRSRQAHSINSIPSLLVFSSNGILITNEGVQFLQVHHFSSSVLADAPLASAFPFSLSFQASMRGSGPAFPFVWGADLIGSHIRLCNIASRPELNGSAGRVVAAIADSKRFRVRLPDAQEMSVARSKLLRSSEGGWGEEFLGKTVTAHGLVKAAHLNGSQVGEGACSILALSICCSQQQLLFFRLPTYGGSCAGTRGWRRQRFSTNHRLVQWRGRRGWERDRFET